MLFVDDDATIRELISTLLEDIGYATLLAQSGLEAMALLNAGESVDVLVTDLSMPGMDGLSLIRAAQAYQPDRLRSCSLVTPEKGRPWRSRARSAAVSACSENRSRPSISPSELRSCWKRGAAPGKPLRADRFNLNRSRYSSRDQRSGTIPGRARTRSTHADTAGQCASSKPPSSATCV